MKVVRRSILDGRERTLDLPIEIEQWERWYGDNPPLIQDCFPQLSASEREFILTGMTDEQWNELSDELENES